MGKSKGRSHRNTDDLKLLAFEMAQAQFSNQGILERLNELDLIGEKPVTLDTLERWQRQRFTGGREEVLQITFEDVMYLRTRAYRATALCEVNRAYITERAYWWGLYISALHIMLKQALAAEEGVTLPVQLIVKDLPKFYADIRAIRQMTPPLDLGEGGEETVEQIKARMKAFEDKFGKDIKLPTETL